MSSKLTIANLNVSDEHLPSIQFQTIAFHSHETGKNHGILGFQVVGEGSDAKSLNEHEKTHAKGKRCGAKFAYLLNGMEGQSQGRILDPVLSLQDRSLVGGPPSGSYARTIKGLASFQEMDFRFPISTNYFPRDALKSSQYLHVTAPTLKGHETLFHDNASSSYDHVEIISGICLFSMKILNSSFFDNGRPNIHKLTHVKPTLYEMDHILRASSTIADVASLIILRNRDRAPATPGVSVGITLDVPSFQYYYNVAQKLDEGLCSSHDALKWLEATERRHDEVCDAFQNAVGIALKKRGVVQGEYGIVPEFLAALSILKSDGGVVWNDFYNLLKEKEQPKDFRALGYLFYVFEVMRYALQQEIPVSRRIPASLDHLDKPAIFSETTMERRPRRLLISVDDRDERKIYTRCQNLLKILRKRPNVEVVSDLVELYMCRRIFVNSNGCGDGLYRDDPSPAVPRVLLQGCKREEDSESHSYVNMEQQEVLRHLYGPDFVPFLEPSRAVPRCGVLLQAPIVKNHFAALIKILGHEGVVED
ncbi:hypothetical protein G7Y89_g15870 [Cudoniella acicularis]|uniref:Uncharacterized protein n=1 Tax=Cudoniella acicularis TaxID=354080 RepID=A0A8H4QEJ5_9HELO|nr:hypothetical protein G7Y89_g15870 [Cudoniella acicularis]